MFALFDKCIWFFLCNVLAILVMDWLGLLFCLVLETGWDAWSAPGGFTC